MELKRLKVGAPGSPPFWAVRWPPFPYPLELSSGWERHKEHGGKKRKLHAEWRDPQPSPHSWLPEGWLIDKTQRRGSDLDSQAGKAPWGGELQHLKGEEEGSREEMGKSISHGGNSWRREGVHIVVQDGFRCNTSFFLVKMSHMFNSIVWKCPFQSTHTSPIKIVDSFVY